MQPLQCFDSGHLYCHKTAHPGAMKGHDMKLTMKLLALLFGVLLLANAADAESPREQLRQMVEQLQQSPNDNALREQIIKLAQSLKPALALPDEAGRRMVRGAAAFKGAKSVVDYRDAAKEFEQATLAAPWYGDAYFNLGFVQDKAENYEAALRSLKLAQLASPEVKEIKALIYEVEYRSEKANSPEAHAAKRKQQEQEERRAAEEMIRGLEGVEFVKQGGRSFDQSHGILRIRGNRLESVDRKLEANHCPCAGGRAMCDLPVGAVAVCLQSNPLVGRSAEAIYGSWVIRYEISSDGREIVSKSTSIDGAERGYGEPVGGWRYERR